MCALVVLLAGGAAAGVIALKTAIFFLRYHYHSLGRDRLYSKYPQQRRWHEELGRSKR